MHTLGLDLKSQAREHYCCSVFFVFLRIRKRENEGNKINELKKMNKVKSLLKPKPNPSEQLRDWQRRLRQECRNLERQIRGNGLSISIKVSFFCKLRMFLFWVNFSWFGFAFLCFFNSFNLWVCLFFVGLVINLV